jgi:hypothetical protein
MSSERGGKNLKFKRVSINEAFCESGIFWDGVNGSDVKFLMELMRWFLSNFLLEISFKNL